MKRYTVMIVIAALAAILYIWTIRTEPEPVLSGRELVSVISSAPITPEEGVLEARIYLPGGPSPEQSRAHWQQELITLGTALLSWDEEDQGVSREPAQAGKPVQAAAVPFIPVSSGGWSITGVHGAGSLATVAGSVLADVEEHGLYKKSHEPATAGCALDDRGNWPGHFGSSKAPVIRQVLTDPAGRVELELILIARQEGPGRLTARATFQDITLLPKLESHWQQVWSAYGYRAEYATLLSGTIDGEPAYNVAHQLLTNIFQTLEVEQPVKMTDENIISWAGHSPRLSTALRDVRGEPINIQAAIRYHHLEDRTHIYLGSPLIYRDF